MLCQSHLNLNTNPHLLSLRVPGAAALVRREESSSNQKRESGSTSSAGSTREEEEIMMEPIPRVEEDASEVFKHYFSLIIVLKSVFGCRREKPKRKPALRGQPGMLRRRRRGNQVQEEQSMKSDLTPKKFGRAISSAQFAG